MEGNRIAMIVGGPGVGKSTVLKEVLSIMRKKNTSIALCAASGKASKRMTETTGEPASTIHKLLEAQMDGGDFRFAKNETNTLDYDFVVCDEVSMVGCDLMADLLRAIDPQRTKILFVGDQDQLPSISPGSVLRDFLNSKVIPTVELDQIFRNSGDIVRACHKIKTGERYTPSASLDPENGLNIRHIEASNPQKIVEIIRELVSVRMPARGFNPIWDVQVLSPTNTRTAMSCQGINEVLQSTLNKSPAVEGCKFKPGDKAIQTKNQPVGNDYIVNGDLCEILEVTEKEIKAKFFDPDREVTLPRNHNNLLLAYCITCHRAQGSEFPVVIIPVHNSFSFIVNRPWIYTGISRAREVCVSVGQFDAIGKAIKREAASQRRTLLKEKIMNSSLKER
jgi:exodeoxyribonuclease V alpha subunit